VHWIGASGTERNYSAFEVQRKAKLAHKQAGFERQQARIAEIQRC